MKGSWKTTLAGVLLAFGLGAQSEPAKKVSPGLGDFGQLAGVAGAVLLGWKSKDNDVTGGVRQ